MKYKSHITWLLSFLLLLSGCGEVKPSRPLAGPPAGPPGGPPAGPPAQGPNISSNWQFTTTSTVPAGIPPATISGSIVQSGSVVTGAVHVDGWSCFDQHTAISLTGTITDGNIALTSASVDGQVLTLAGAITTKANFPDVLNGTYAVAGGCADGDQGNLNGESVFSVTGNWAGDLTTTGGENIHWNTDLTQGSADSEGSFGLTGGSAFDGCLGSGTISSGTFPSASYIMGESVNLEIKTSNGTITFLGKAEDDGLIGGNFVATGTSCDTNGTGYLSPWEY
jgi:hypothetical protein